MHIDPGLLRVPVAARDRGRDAASLLLNGFQTICVLFHHRDWNCKTSASPMSATRSGRLAASRQAQAFQALLERDISDDDEGVLDRRHSSRKAGAAKERRDRRRGSASTAVAGFSLRDGVSEVDQAAAGTADELVSQLRQMFPTANTAILADVSAACGGSLNSAIDALLAMNLKEEPAQLSAQSVLPAEGAHVSISSLFRVSARLSALARTSTLLQGCQHTSMMAMPGSGWDAIPAECKLLIFEQLNMRELARAARTCREFAAHIRGLRASLTAIVLPRGGTRPVCFGCTPRLWHSPFITLIQALQHPAAVAVVGF